MSYSIDSEIRAGEHVLWKGEPAKGVILQPSDAFLIPFSLVWGGFAVFWEFMAVTHVPKSAQTGPGVIFPLFGIPFVLMGLYMIIGRFFVDAKIRANTQYALTNERAIISSGLCARKTKSINVKTVSDISITEKDNGWGTITFGESLYPMRYRSFPGMELNATPAFRMIPEVRKVYSLIGKVQQE